MIPATTEQQQLQKFYGRLLLGAYIALLAARLLAMVLPSYTHPTAGHTPTSSMTVSKVNSPASSPGKDNSGASSEHGWQGRFGHLPTDDIYLFQNPENRERSLPPPTISWRQRASQEFMSKVSSLCTFFRLPPMPGFDLSAFTHGVHMFLQMVFVSLVLLVAGRLIWEEALFHQASSFKEAVRPLLVFLGILRGSTTVRAMWRAFWDLLLG